MDSYEWVMECEHCCGLIGPEDALETCCVCGIQVCEECFRPATATCPDCVEYNPIEE